MLTQMDKENMLRDFPNVKLSYENITHKKVYRSDYIVAIPEGIKCFAWFTDFNDKKVCLIMELSSTKQIQNMKVINACFSNELAYGTILYGTMIYHLHNKFFSIEDIFSFKGISLERESWGEKLIKINSMLKTDLRQISYNNSFIVFGLPIMCKTNEDLERSIIGHKIESIQYKLFNRVNNYLVMSYKNYMNERKYVSNNTIAPNVSHNNVSDNNVSHNNVSHNNVAPNNQLKSNNRNHILEKEKYKTNKESIFLVKPDIQDDIYHLYCLNTDLKETLHSIAHIPNYDTSVMMNKLFRIIKENNNLDALEESDDEEEFENNRIDKFVHLNKSYKMVCQYNNKFKKWTPIKLANENQHIVNIQTILYK